ncbi:MAG TPA: 30S ribosomal protein S13 [Halobacteria archaeon]|jgi:small subunit ribosomal protein S13|nr:30S ribosomal protein S13 [Halobacteria archaeon]HIH77406.1 30S ribosomal protein S13 [Halobacteria archaeon]
METEIKHLVRIANTDLNGNKQVFIALSRVKGIGKKMAKIIASRVNIDPYVLLGSLSDDDIDRLKKEVENFGKDPDIPSWLLNRRNDYSSGDNIHLIGTDIDITVTDDINRLKKIRSYRGLRHEKGYKVRGQRTKSTGRKSAVVGVRKKRV